MENTYYGPNPSGFGHGHIAPNGYHRPPVTDDSTQAAMAWTAIHGAMGDGNIQLGKAGHNIGNPSADTGRY
ncbi:MAG: hypothetical protein M3Q10_20900 [Chloroflexota bacterium]|nr:hypothetical protein [Chloroflexota bacterium]